MLPETLDRRTFVKIGGVGAASLLLGSTAPFARANTRPPRFDKDPFTLDVASGDPLPDGTVIWTRLAPEPLAGAARRPQPGGARGSERSTRRSAGCPRRSA
jgi:alkaline phosphatase D